MVLLRKAQVETFGLVIIVILLSFILIFALRFITKPKQTGLEEDYLQLQANNLRSVILKTNLCPETTIKEEIVNCQFNSPDCSESCDLLWNAVEEIIEKSVQAKVKYEFTVDVIDAEPLHTLNLRGSCENPITAVSEPLAGTNLKVSVKLCHD